MGITRLERVWNKRQPDLQAWKGETPKWAQAFVTPFFFLLFSCETDRNSKRRRKKKKKKTGTRYGELAPYDVAVQQNFKLKF